KPKDLANEKEILPLRLRSGLKALFAQNDSFAVTLAHFRHFRHFPDKRLTTYQLTSYHSPDIRWRI
ncbi:MAG: hypothetical protein ABIL62_04575, partial [Planctomycetota bacterium]